MNVRGKEENLPIKVQTRRSNYSKYILLYVLEILHNYTNADQEGEEEQTKWPNALSLKQMQQKIVEISGDEKAPKAETIQRAIESINAFYYEQHENYPIIRVLDGNKKIFIPRPVDDQEENKIKGNRYIEHKYCMREKALMQEEVILLYNIIRYSNMISSSEAVELGDKLLQQVSEKERNLIKKKPFLTDGSGVTNNYEVYKNLTLLTKCIGEESGISFTYNEYRLDKKLYPKKGKYEVFPHGISWSDGKGYLIASYTGRESDLQIRVYRIDKMTEIKECIIVPTQEQRSLRVEDYVKNSAFMFARQQKIRVELRCHKKILSNVIEKFADCELKQDPIDENYFEATIKGTTEQGMLYWVLEFSSACEVRAPESLRNKVRDTLKEALSWYETRPK